MSLDRSIVPEVTPFGKMTVPPQEVVMLSNGITLHIYRGGDQPICNFSVVFPGGTAEMGSECLATLVTAQMIEGTRHHSSQEIAGFLDFYGVRFGFRAYAHNTIADFYMLTEKAHDVLPMIAEIVSEPIYPATELATAKTRISSSLLAAHEDVASLAGELFNELICGPGNPIGRPLTQELIDSIAPEVLRREYNIRFSPAGMHLFLSGMVDDDLIKLVAVTFGSLPGNRNIPRYHIAKMKPSAPGTHFIAKEDAFQSAIICGLPTIGRNNPDYIPLRLAVMALGGYFGSRLMKNIREEKGLTYGIGASLSGSQDGAYMSIAAQCDCSMARTVVKEIKNELHNLGDNPPEGDELHRLKLNAMTSLAELLDSPQSILSYYANNLLVGTPDKYFESQQKAIETLSPENIARGARLYLNPERLIIVTAGGKRANSF